MPAKLKVVHTFGINDWVMTVDKKVFQITEKRSDGRYNGTMGAAEFHGYEALTLTPYTDQKAVKSKTTAAQL